MKDLTPANAALFRRLSGQTPEPSGETENLAGSPTLIRIEGPEVDIEAIVAAMDEDTMEGRRRNRALARREGQAFSVNESGKPTLYGRECCYTFAMKLNREVHRHRLPSRHVCPGCGTTYSLELRTREERRHG